MLDWIKGIFSGDSATSFSRVATAVSLLFSCEWCTYIVHSTKHLPDLSGIALLNGSIYGMGKINETIQKSSDNSTAIEKAKVDADIAKAKVDAEVEKAKNGN